MASLWLGWAFWIVLALTLFIGHGLASPSNSPSFHCHKWIHDGKTYYLNDLDKVFKISSSDYMIHLSICKPLPKQYLKPPSTTLHANASDSGCPLGSHVCAWHMNLSSTFGSLGSSIFATVNAKDNIIVDILNGSESPNSIFPMMSRVALVYNEAYDEPSLLGPEIADSVFHFRLVSKASRPANGSRPPPKKRRDDDPDGDKDQGMGFFATLFLLMLIGLSCYFVFGFIYKSSVLGMSGVDALPHSQFWITAFAFLFEACGSFGNIFKKQDTRGAYSAI